MKENKAKKIILIILAVICVAVLVFSLYQGMIIYIPQKQEQQRFEELRQIVEQDGEGKSDSSQPPEAETKSSSPAEENRSGFVDIVRINDDFRGWLKIKDMVIDYPVVKSSDDDLSSPRL